MDKEYDKEIEIRKECANDFELWQYNNSHSIPRAYKHIDMIITLLMKK